MATIATKNKRSNTANQVFKSAKKTSAIEKKMVQMRETLKKYPLPTELSSK
jgi:hypothetical protein